MDLAHPTLPEHIADLVALADQVLELSQRRSLSVDDSLRGDRGQRPLVLVAHSTMMPLVSGVGSNAPAREGQATNLGLPSRTLRVRIDNHALFDRSWHGTKTTATFYGQLGVPLLFGGGSAGASPVRKTPSTFLSFL